MGRGLLCLLCFVRVVVVRQNYLAHSISFLSMVTEGSGKKSGGKI